MTAKKKATPKKTGIKKKAPGKSTKKSLIGVDPLAFIADDEMKALPSDVEATTGSAETTKEVRKASFSSTILHHKGRDYAHWILRWVLSRDHHEFHVSPRGKEGHVRLWSETPGCDHVAHHALRLPCNSSPYHSGTDLLDRS